MGRKSKGSVLKTRDGRWQAFITLADGTRKRLQPFPKGMSRAMAEEKTAKYAEQARQMGLRRSEEPKPAALPEREGCLPAPTPTIAHKRHYVNSRLVPERAFIGTILRGLAKMGDVEGAAPLPTTGDTEALQHRQLVLARAAGVALTGK